MTASIIGWSHSTFGKKEESLEELIVTAARDALAHAKVSADEVDEIVLGHFNAGFSAQDFTASLILQADPALRFKPTTRVENACATGSAAVHMGARAIAAKDYWTKTPFRKWITTAVFNVVYVVRDRSEAEDPLQPLINSCRL